jgi:hypothetical protein
MFREHSLVNTKKNVRNGICAGFHICAFGGLPINYLKSWAAVLIWVESPGFGGMSSFYTLHIAQLVISIINYLKSCETMSFCVKSPRFGCVVMQFLFYIDV